MSSDTWSAKSVIMLGILAGAFAIAVSTVFAGEPLSARAFFNDHDIAAGSAYRSTLRTVFMLQLLAQSFVLLLLLWSRSGIQFRLWSAINADGRPFVMTALMALGTFVLLKVVELPLDFYRGFLVQHRFGLSTQTGPSWFGDWLLDGAIELTFFVVGVTVIYRCILYSSSRWWLPAGFLAGGIVVVFVWLAPVVLDPLFNEFTVLQDRALAGRIQALARQAGVPVDEVHVMDASRRTRTANAYYTGLWGTRRIVLYDTLLQRFSTAEIVSVVGHELGHWQRGHVVTGMFLGIAGLFLALMVTSRLLLVSCNAGWFGLRDPADPANLPLLLLIATVLHVATLPVGCALSRYMERQADATALALTHDAPAFIEVERKLARLNLADLHPPDWAVVLLHTHPPVMERIAAAVAYGRPDTTYPSPHESTPQGSDEASPTR